MKERIIEFLFNNANPSIVLRVKKEILGSMTAEEECKLLDKIILEPNVQTVIQSQKSDGWFGNGFHGQSPINGVGMFDNMEVGLRYLAEKGLPPESEYISKAVNSFLLDEPHFNDCRLNAPPDDYNITALGLYLMRSSIIIRAGYEKLLPENDYIDLKHDIDFSLKTFLNVLNYTDLDDVVDTSRRKLCFKQGIIYPCSYDLRMLAHSQGWRNKESISALADSLNHIFSFAHNREKMIYTYKKGQYISPCLAFIHNQIYCLGLMGDDYINFDLTERFARCGIIQQVDFLKSKYERLLSLVNDDLTVDYKITSRERDWSPYGGFALEEDWKTKIRKQCDLLFRILLITHYVEKVL
jgi:hypothetical protein